MPAVLRAVVVVVVVCVTGCDAAPAGSPPDAASVDAAEPDAFVRDASPGDTGSIDDVGSSDVPLVDAALSDDLSAHRDRLVATLGASCAAWSSLDASARAVFLTITHRLYVSRTPDGLSMLSHVTAVHAVLGGGASGTTCGGADNNRVFFSTDAYLHGLLVDTWNDATPITDGAGSTWIHTRDAAGPHDPFDASVETDLGLRCTLLFETSGSMPPTGQAHFFLATPVAFTRGTATLPADPFMLEVDQDYNCVHDSNPTCRDFEDRYRTNHGDFVCDWIPSACTATGTGCYRDVAGP